MARLLVVDDEPSICWGLSKLAESLGHRVKTAGSAEQALEQCGAGGWTPDLVFLDVRLPGLDGISAIPQFRTKAGGVPIIVMTAYGDLRTAVEAVRGGAYEYLVKPFELQAVRRLLERALPGEPSEKDKEQEKARAKDREKAEKTGAIAPANLDLVGKSAAMQEVFKRIALVAPSSACVYLSGESGTGKELVARAIHRYSLRADGPFVAVNVAALSPTLAESELFGHVRGAFTGAEQARRGLLEQSHGGTIFLDEVAEIPPAIQVKLLRALEYGEILPVGSDRPIHADFRLVSATHRDLADAVQTNEFRHDLYFRLSTFQIQLPPLRDRREDVSELADHFTAQLCRKNRTPVPPLSDRFREELSRRPWHGNVRELRNAIEHALILARGGTLEPEHLPPPARAMGASAAPAGPDAIQGQLRHWAEEWVRQNPERGDLYDTLLQLVEPPVLGAALAAGSQQCAAAARVLGMHRVTLKKKVDQYGLAGEN